MAFEDLRERMRTAMAKLRKPEIVDQNHILQEIAGALLQSDVRVTIVLGMKDNIERDLDDLKGQNKENSIKQAIFMEICRILHSSTPYYMLIRRQMNVVMFVGLPGSGKTTACFNYAHHFSSDGWKSAIICAASGSDAYVQLRQKTSQTKIAAYGSDTESDPVNVILEGVDIFRTTEFDLVIVDTSCSHEQAATVFQELSSCATEPDLVILVVDSSDGQAAYDHVRAFKQSLPVGAVIATKLDGNAKAAGALSAVAATETPVIFIGTGENETDFKVFDVKSHVNDILEVRLIYQVWYGAAPVQRALQDGVRETGVSLAYTLRALNYGPVIAKEKLEIDDYVKIKPDESWLSFDEDACILHNKVRAFAGWPRTRARIRILSVGSQDILEVKIISTKYRGSCSLDGDKDESTFLGDALIFPCAGQTLLEVFEIQLPGKKVMKARDFWNGVRGQKLKKLPEEEPSLETLSTTAK